MIQPIQTTFSWIAIHGELLRRISAVTHSLIQPPRRPRQNPFMRQVIFPHPLLQAEQLSKLFLPLRQVKNSLCLYLFLISDL